MTGEVETVENSFEYRLKIALLRKRLTQKELSEELGVSPVTVSRWVHGKSTPDSGTARKIAEILDVSLDFLYAMKDSPLPENRTGFDPSDPDWRQRDDIPQLIRKYMDDPDIGPRIENCSRVRAVLTGIAAARGEPTKQGIMSFIDYALYVLDRDAPEAKRAMEEEWNEEE